MTARERLPDRCQFGVEHAVTADMDDGQTLPPFYERDAIWCVVRRLPDQKTLWRRISLRTAEQAAAQLCGNSSSGKQGNK